MNWLKKAKTNTFFEVHLRWKGHFFIEEIGTKSSQAAVTAAKARFPGCYIGKIVRKKRIKNK